MDYEAVAHSGCLQFQFFDVAPKGTPTQSLSFFEANRSIVRWQKKAKQKQLQSLARQTFLQRLSFDTNRNSDSDILALSC